MKRFIIIYLGLFLFYFAYPQETEIMGDVKFSAAMNNIRSYYVDSVNEPKLVEAALKALLKELDPHSVYLTKDEIDRANESLTGNFEGVGVTFQIYHDSVLILTTLKDGPSEKAGIKPGDRILRIGIDTVPTENLNNKWVTDRLRGERGTKIETEIFRPSSGKKIIFEIKRDKIPIYSIETNFMLDNQTGYMKLVRFSAMTKPEFYSALVDLRFSGMQNLILDLRGNSGGYLQTATDLADEFISKGYLLVYTEGVNHPRTNYESTTKGEFEKGRLIVLIDENSASASEILAGAIQDCDRGLIIGRRSYGKGLVQRPYYLPDGSAIRLTTARYYTPSGRLLQKSYKEGTETYFKDLSTRYGKGEYISADSIKFPDSLKYFTYNKRTVYGGGGIMPDIFIPIDTSHNIPWYKNITSASLPYSFAVKYVDDNRENLNRNYPFLKIFEKNFKVEGEILDSFLVFCSANNQNADTVDLSQVADRLPVVIKAHIAALIFDNSHYLRIACKIDETLMKSLEIMNDKNYFRRNRIEF